MSHTVEMELKGLDEAVERLRSLPRKVSKTIVRTGLRAGARVIQATAKELAPVRSGTLKRNIKIRAGRARRDAITVTVGVGKKYFTGDAFYAPFVLWGHKAGPRKLGDARKDVPGHDFLSEAFTQSADKAVDVATKVIVTLIEQVAAGGSDAGSAGE